MDDTLGVKMKESQEMSGSVKMSEEGVTEKPKVIVLQEIF